MTKYREKQNTMLFLLMFTLTTKKKREKAFLVFWVTCVISENGVIWFHAEKDKKRINNSMLNNLWLWLELQL